MFSNYAGDQVNCFALDSVLRKKRATCQHSIRQPNRCRICGIPQYNPEISGVEAFHSSRGRLQLRRAHLQLKSSPNSLRSSPRATWRGPSRTPRMQFWAYTSKVVPVPQTNFLGLPSLVWSKVSASLALTSHKLSTTSILEAYEFVNFSVWFHQVLVNYGNYCISPRRKITQSQSHSWDSKL